MLTTLFNRLITRLTPKPSPGFDSPIEERLYNALNPRVPGLICQHPIGPYRADFAIPHTRLVVECDGHDYHSSPAQKARDAQRDRYLVGRGWIVLRYTGSEIWGDAEGCAREIVEIALQKEKK